MVYQCHYPNRSMQTARGAKVSPVHERLAAARRVLQGRQRLGGRGLVPAGRRGSRSSEPLTWGRPPWFDHWRAEHEAAREGVIVMDMSFMSKFLVQGRDAGRCSTTSRPTTSTASPAPSPTRSGSNERGTIEADLTVTKLDDDRFWVVATDTAHRHVEHLDAAPTIATPTRSSPTSPSGYAQLNVQGPRSRELCSRSPRPTSPTRLPVPHGPRDRHRLRPGAVRPHHLPRRARLRAVHPGRAGRPRLRPADRGRAPRRPAPRRAEGAGQPADGEGLPRLRPRHRQHRPGARGRARVRRGARQAGRLRRPRRGGRRRRRPVRSPVAWSRCWSPTRSR